MDEQQAWYQGWPVLIERARGIEIGTSGWDYAHWRKVFYPTERPMPNKLEYYSRHFDTVELNASFYRLPTKKAFANWRDTTPDGFLFAVKASRYITHIKKLKDPKAPVKLFFERARTLGNKLGPVLYQLPPGWNANEERLDEFLSVLPSGVDHCVEFRNRTWINDEVLAILKKHKAALVISSIPGFNDPSRVTAGFVYMRMHGVHNYGPAALRTWASRIRTLRRKGKRVFIYFNNDAHGYAIKNALKLKEMLKA